MRKVSFEWYVYIVECADGTLYTGATPDIDARVEAHNAGKGAKYTRGRLPVLLRYREFVGLSHKALSREAQIKKMSRAAKLELIRGEEINKKMHEVLDSSECRQQIAMLGIDYIRSCLVG